MRCVTYPIRIDTIPITNGIEKNIAKIAVSVSDSTSFANSFIFLPFVCLYSGIVAGGTDILACISGVSQNYFCDKPHTTNANKTDMLH